MEWNWNHMHTELHEYGMKKSYPLCDIYGLQLSDKEFKWNWEFNNIFGKASDDLSMILIV